jgi:hypothetical protein
MASTWEMEEMFKLNYCLGDNLKSADGMVLSLINLFCQFCLSAQSNNSLAHISQSDMEYIELLHTILASKKNGFTLKWFPEYFCVLLAVRDVDRFSSQTSLEIICLDKW